MKKREENKSNFDRRNLIKGALAGIAATAIGASQTEAASASFSTSSPLGTGKIRQSIVHWCFNASPEKWTLEQSCKATKKLGCESVELIAPEDWPTLKKHGVTCAIVPNGMPGAPFKKGLNNPKFQDEVVTRTKKAIEGAGEAGYPNVIAFNGYKWIEPDNPKSGEISLEEGAKNCIKGLKALAGLAEKKGVTVCIEHLNTRDDTHPMKGHPGYQGDDLDYVADIVRKVGSSHVKLLFDIYHVQVMNGDVMRRLEQNKDIIGHVHTAGCPGRGELSESQEIYYPPIMKKLIEIGYKGFVGQEFIPTGDAFKGLKQAVELCHVD